MKDTLQPSIQDYFHRVIGKPYDNMDCWQLVDNFYKEVLKIDLGINPKYINPNNQNETTTIINQNLSNVEKVDCPVFGDIILIKVYGLNAHLGIYIDDDCFLHTLEKTGCILDRLSKWKCKVEGFYRWQK